MIKATFDVSRLVERMKRAQSRLPTEIDAALDRVAKEAIDDLKATATFKDRTGNLRRSFAALSLPGFKRIVLAGNPAIPYAKYLEHGTRASADSWNAHTAIGLRRAVGFAVDKALRKRAGSWRIKPRRFFAHARNIVRRRLKAALVRAVALATRK